MKRAAFLVVAMLAFPASAQITQNHLQIICMPVQTFLRGVSIDETIFVSAPTAGGGFVELWTSEDSHTLVYYPSEVGRIACVIGSGGKIVRGPRGEKI